MKVAQKHMNPFDNPWKTLSSRAIYENAWIKVREDEVVRPDGKSGIYGVVSPQNYAIGVLPLHGDGTITLVGQFRYTLNQYSWEIPEGGCPFDEAPIEAARRELKEETGLIAAQIVPLCGEIHLTNSISDERGYLFLATQLTQGKATPEGTEQLLTRRISLEESVKMIISGEINDALTIMGLLLVQKISQAL